MLKGLVGNIRLSIAYGYTDMRKGIDGLAALVKQESDPDPFSTDDFVFCGRRRDRIKVLLWIEEDSELCYKCLENGAFQWPRNRQEAMEVTLEQYGRLLSGLAIEERRTIHPAGSTDMF